MCAPVEWSYARIASSTYHRSIFYLNQEWDEVDGGCLRLHLASGEWDVAPTAGKLVIFFSDARVPHEVLPTFRDRYAITVWYSDAAAEMAAAAEERAAPQSEDLSCVRSFALPGSVQNVFIEVLYPPCSVRLRSVS